MPDPVDFLRTVPIGTRVVIRARIPGGGFTDTLGYVRFCSDEVVMVVARDGDREVVLDRVVAAKAVPEPPPRRAPCGPLASS